MPAPRPNRRTTLGKLCPLRLGRVFARQRLFAQLDESADVPGAWVAGPPGIGKTALVATYLEARATPCVWLQLDAGDALGSFYAAAAAADAIVFLGASLDAIEPWTQVLKSHTPAYLAKRDLAEARAALKPGGASVRWCSRSPRATLAWSS